MRRSAVVAAVLAVVLSGCGDEPGVDTEAVEGYLATSQAGAYEGLEVGAPDCPADEDLREDLELACTLTVADVQVPYRVTLRDVESAEVSIEVELERVVVVTSAVQDYVRTLLSEEYAAASVACDGADLVVTDVGETLDCTLALGAEVTPLRVTVEDEAGHVSVA